MRPPIRVVHLITTLELGGAETALTRLVTRLDPRQFSTKVIALTGPGALVPALRAAGIDASVMHHSRSVTPQSLWRLVRAVRRARPAVLQTWLYHADCVGLLLAPLIGVRGLAWNIRCSDLDPAHDGRSLFWIRSVLARFSRVPQVIVVNSEAGRVQHERIGYRPRRWELIPNGFDSDVFAPSDAMRAAVRRELGIPDDAPVVGLLARYHAVKDHATFLAAMARVAPDRPGLRILLAGQGVDPGNRELARVLDDLHLRPRAILLGITAHPERLLNALDVAVSASAYGEGFANVVAEAMSCGVPVVATDVGDSARIIGSCGSLVPSRNPAALAAAVASLLARSPSERRALGVAARQRIVDAFALDAVVGRYARLYQELAGAGEWGP